MSVFNGIEFGVVDVETTGFSPARGDRVIEIAVVRIDAVGRKIAEYHTLVNPERDPGPTHIHGLRARDLKDAPRFEVILGDVLALLHGAVFVAHNASFDWRFVYAECERVGVTLPRVDWLCTMQLSKVADESVDCRKLASLCTRFGVEYLEHHSARTDAIATAQLLTKCLNAIGDFDGSRFRFDVDRSVIKLPTDIARPSGVRLSRESAASIRETSFIKQLIDRLPIGGEFVLETQEYCAILDRVLEDRLISADEGRTLFEVASEFGLDRSKVVEVHRSYLRNLLSVAWSDGGLSRSEQNDLEEVRRLLCISESEYTELNDAARITAADRAPARDVINPSFSGLRVCFTGALTCSIDGKMITRSKAERLAEDRGMVVDSSVTKKTEILVIADPHSQSSKAVKARKYGTRILAEPVFWSMIGVTVD